MLSITKKEDILRKVIFIRNLRSIKFNTFVADIHLYEITGDNLDYMVEALKTKVSLSLDIHAPVTTKQITLCSSNPWYTEGLRKHRKICKKETENMTQVQMTSPVACSNQ